MRIDIERQGLADDVPIRAKPIIGEPAPMNVVGLFALLVALASYGGSAIAGLALALGRYYHPLPAVYSGGALAAGGLALLVVHLADQRIVRPFAAWAVRLAGGLLACSAASEAWFRL